MRIAVCALVTGLDADAIDSALSAAFEMFGPDDQHVILRALERVPVLVCWMRPGTITNATKTSLSINADAAAAALADDTLVPLIAYALAEVLAFNALGIFAADDAVQAFAEKLAASVGIDIKLVDRLAR
jgi:hypothetical protein